MRGREPGACRARLAWGRRQGQHPVPRGLAAEAGLAPDAGGDRDRPRARWPVLCVAGQRCETSCPSPESPALLCCPVPAAARGQWEPLGAGLCGRRTAPHTPPPLGPRSGPGTSVPRGAFSGGDRLAAGGSLNSEHTSLNRRVRVCVCVCFTTACNVMTGAGEQSGHRPAVGGTSQESALPR